MKNIIVTGASGNLGDAVVRHFLESGYRIIAPLHAGNKLKIENENLETITVDATDAQAVRDFIGAMVSKKQSIDGMLLLVGGFAPGTLEKTTVVDVRKMIALNFESAYNFVQPVLELMKKQADGGKIILVGSKPGKNPAAARTSVAYALAKSLVFRLGEIINAEGQKNISATVFVPGTIDTPDNRKAMPRADFSKWNNAADIAAKMEQVIAGRESANIIEF